MTEFTQPHVIGQPGNARSYHTKECRTVQNTDKDATPISENTIEWHDLRECKYCDGSFTPNKKGKAVSDD